MSFGHCDIYTAIITVFLKNKYILMYNTWVELSTFFGDIYSNKEQESMGAVYKYPKKVYRYTKVCMKI